MASLQYEKRVIQGKGCFEIEGFEYPCCQCVVSRSIDKPFYHVFVTRKLIIQTFCRVGVSVHIDIAVVKLNESVGDELKHQMFWGIMPYVVCVHIVGFCLPRMGGLLGVSGC